MTPREQASEICERHGINDDSPMAMEIAAAIEKAGRVPEGCVMFDDGTVYDIGVLHEDGRPKGSPRDWFHGGTWVTPGMKVIECYPREAAAAKGGGDGDR